MEQPAARQPQRELLARARVRVEDRDGGQEGHVRLRFAPARRRGKDFAAVAQVEKAQAGAGLRDGQQRGVVHVGASQAQLRQHVSVRRQRAPEHAFHAFSARESRLPQVHLCERDEAAAERRVPALRNGEAAGT